MFGYTPKNCMKKFAMSVLLFFFLTACTAGEEKQSSNHPPQSGATQSTEASVPGVSVSEAVTDSSGAGEEKSMIPVTITIGSQTFPALFYDNETARAVMECFPVTLEMDDLNQNEKYHFFTDDFPVSAEDVGIIASGDIMLYGPDCLVLFYETFQTSYRYTRLGYLEDPEELASVLGAGSTAVSFNYP